MLIQSTNIAATGPDSLSVRAGLLRDDLFVAVHDQFMTDTALLADIVLPATMFLEHDDVYQAGGHTHIQVGAKLIEPAGRMPLQPRGGLRAGGAFGRGARRFPDEFDGGGGRDLRASGWPGAAEVREARWVDAQAPFAEAHFLDGFGHADGRFHSWPTGRRSAGWGSNAAAARPLGGDRRRHRRAPVPHGCRAGQAVPELDVSRRCRHPAAVSSVPACC